MGLFVLREEWLLWKRKISGLFGRVKALEEGGGGGGATSLDGLSDVTITTAASGEFLRHNGSAFVDATIQASDIPTGVDAIKIADGSISNAEFQTLNNVGSNIQTQLDAKQATLVSGTNIKTVNNTSLLGSGNITISGGSGTDLGYFVADASTYGNDSTDAYAHIQALIEAANTAGGGAVYLPKGIYRCSDTLMLYKHVDLMGAGSPYTIIKSTTADTLLSTNAGHTGIGDVPQLKRHSLVAGLTLDGDDIGTIGYHIYRYSNFLVQDVWFIDFTTMNTYSDASIYGTFNECHWDGGAIGLYCSSGNGYMGNNMIKVYNSEFLNFTSWGIDVLNGQHMSIVGCTIERNGTNSNVNTGGIRAVDMGDYTGLSMKNCWLEANAGTVVYLKTTNVWDGPGVIHSFDNVQIIADGFGFTASRGIYAIKEASWEIFITLKDCSIDVGGTDVVTDGTGVTVKVLGGVMTEATHSEANGSTYTVIY